MASLASAPAASAQGWADYRLDVGSGYTIIRANTFDICLADSKGTLLVCPGFDSPTFGPIEAIAETDTHLLTRNSGAEPCEKNAALRCADMSVEFFFAVRKQDGHVEGPLSRLDFERRFPDSLGPMVEWRRPVPPWFVHFRSLLLGCVGILVAVGIWHGLVRGQEPPPAPPPSRG